MKNIVLCTITTRFFSIMRTGFRRGWSEPLAICQGQEEGNRTPATLVEESFPATATLPSEGWSAISPNMPTTQSRQSPLFIRINCPWNVGANANDKVPYMSAIQVPRVLAIEAPCSSANNTSCASDTQTPCLTEIKALCLPEIRLKLHAFQRIKVYAFPR